MSEFPLHQLANIDVQYEDNHVIVAVKPPNMLSQADKTGDTDILTQLKEYIKIKYNKPGGSVIVRTLHESGMVRLIVEDTGIGIAGEHCERIFERFYRVDKSRSKSTGGTGLGLAIVKHILLKLNAEIELKSEPGEGTEITVTFPAIREARFRQPS